MPSRVSDVKSVVHQQISPQLIPATHRSANPARIRRRGRTGAVWERIISSVLSDSSRARMRASIGLDVLNSIRIEQLQHKSRSTSLRVHYQVAQLFILLVDYLLGTFHFSSRMSSLTLIVFWMWLTFRHTSDFIRSYRRFHNSTTTVYYGIVVSKTPRGPRLSARHSVFSARAVVQWCVNVLLLFVLTVSIT